MDDDTGSTTNYGRLFEAVFSEADSESIEDASSGRVNGYVLLEKIGEGGMGVVWKAREPDTGRTVALKQLRFVDVSRSGNDDDAKARFRREIALAARLEHPGIARVYDSGVDQASGAPFFTMERVEGKPFGGETLSEREAVAAMLPVCEAVEHAHRNGVIHRDLKPANILVTPEGEAKVLDFGVARALEDSEIRSDLFAGDPAMTLSRDGEIFGTPNYMAPEQARGESARCDTRTDVYALGTILYRQVTGGFPHDPDKRTTWELLHEVADAEPRRPSEVAQQKGRPRPSPDVEAILMKALSRSPDGRYDSAGELGRDLQHFLDGEPVTAQPLTASYWLKKHVARHRGRWLSAVLVFLALVLLGILWMKQREAYLAEQVELREKAETEETAARQAEVRGLVRLARSQAEAGARTEALALLARAVRVDHDNREARASLLVTLKQFSTMPRASATAKFEGSAMQVDFSSDGSWFALLKDSREAGMEIRDSATLEPLAVVEGEFGARDMKISPAGDFAAGLLAYPDTTEGIGGSCLILLGPDGVLYREEFAHDNSRLAFSPDGKQLAVSGEPFDEAGDRTGSIAIWDVAEPAAAVVSHPWRGLDVPGFARILFSADGEHLYFLKQEQDARLHRWSLDSAEIVRTEMRAAPEGWRPLFLNTAVRHKDGRLFMAGQGEFVACWRDHGERQERLWTSEVSGAVAFHHLALSADGRYLAGATTDSKAVVWDAASGERLADLPHDERLDRVRFSPTQPEILATRTSAHSVSLWDWKNQSLLAEPLEGGERIFSIAFSPDGERVLVGRGGHVRMWGLEPRGWKPKEIDCGARVESVVFTGWGTRLLATSFEGENALLCDGHTGEVLAKWPHRTLYAHNRSQNRFPAIRSRHSRRCVTANSTTELVVRSLDLDPAVEPIVIPLEREATAVAFHPNGRHLAVGDADHVTRIFDLDAEEDDGPHPPVVSELKGEGLPPWELRDWERRYPELRGKIDDFIQTLAFSPNGSRLVMVEFPLPALTLWDWQNGNRMVGRAVLAENTILDLQFSRDNRSLAFGGHSARMRTVKLRGAQGFGPYRFHRKSVTQLRIADDSNRMMSAALDGEVSFWNLSDNRTRPVTSYRPGDSSVRAMALCRESFLGATGDEAGKIHLWLVNSGRPFADPLDAGSAVYGLGFHPRVPILAAACGDGKIRLWEIPTARLSYSHGVCSLAETLAGQYLADDGTVKPGAIFHLDPLRRDFQELYQKAIDRRKREVNYRPNDGVRLAFEIFGLPEIPPPAWLDGSMKSK